MPIQMELRLAAIGALILGATATVLWLLFDTAGTPYQPWAFAATMAVLTASVVLVPTCILPLIDENGYTARRSQIHGYFQAAALSLLTAAWLLTAVIYAAWSGHNGRGAAFALLGLLLGYTSYHALSRLRRATLYHAERNRQTPE